MSEEEVLVQVARRHGVLGIVAVKKCLPLYDGLSIGRLRRREQFLSGGIWSFGTLDEPAGNSIKFVLLEWREAERHAVVGVFFQIPT